LLDIILSRKFPLANAGSRKKSNPFTKIRVMRTSLACASLHHLIRDFSRLLILTGLRSLTGSPAMPCPPPCSPPICVQLSDRSHERATRGAILPTVKKTRPISRYFHQNAGHVMPAMPQTVERNSLAACLFVSSSRPRIPQWGFASAEPSVSPHRLAQNSGYA
jgi:hypothetical protein